MRRLRLRLRFPRRDRSHSTKLHHAHLPPELIELLRDILTNVGIDDERAPNAHEAADVELGARDVAFAFNPMPLSSVVGQSSASLGSGGVLGPL